MNTHIAPIEVETKKLFDGFEKNLFSNIYSVSIRGYGLIKVDPSIIEKNSFDQLSTVFNAQVLDKIAGEKKFMFDAGIFPGFVGTGELDLKYLLVEDLVLIFSIGEFQPARYIFYFEGAWKIAELG